MKLIKLFFMVCTLCVTLISCDDHDCEVIPESQIELEKISKENPNIQYEDSLISKLRALNESRQNKFCGDDTRGFKDWWNVIKIGLADLRGGVVGFMKGGWGGIVIGAIIYSVACAISLTLENLSTTATDSIAKSQLQKERVEYIYSNISIHPDVIERVKTESKQLYLRIPEKFENSYEAAIRHNAMLYLYSDEYYDKLKIAPVPAEIDSLFMNEMFRSFYNSFMEDPINRMQESLKKSSYVNVNHRDLQIVLLFVDACENLTSNIKDVCDLANDYFSIIENDNSLSDNSKSMIYGSIAIGVYSINFWDLNQNVYNITQGKL